MNHIERLSFLCISTLGFCLFSSTPALADQCAYISKDVAQKAIAQLKINQDIYHFCELCGDQVPESIEVNEVSMEKVELKDFWQVKVNDEGIDLAYIYVESEADDKDYKNLAATVGCPTTDVSPTLS